MDSRSSAVRLSMAVTGLVLVGCYLLVGSLLAEVAASLWASRPDPVLFVAAMLASALLFGYASYRGGTARILRSLDAVDLPRERAPQLHARVDRLSEQLDVERPQLLVARMHAPNALALGGRKRGVVVLDASLFRILSLDELETIVAHELAHLESRDSLVQTLGFSVAQTVSGFVFLLLLPVGLLVAGFRRSLRWIRGERPRPFGEHLRRTHAQVASAVVVVMLVLTLALRAHSRRREIAADDRAVELTGSPMTLARALARIQRASEPPGGLLSSLYIHGSEEGTLTRLLATHPPMQERIERLVEEAESAWQRIEIQ
ncbi:M48 family metalloprotease [Haloarchaeobius amylolyticus]|uniref:M48 family metalloprotease n=1 Tax=Haloarchaeobius amylolyticus TaxID=1198296 RepID=UPI00226F8EFD|nr:M48 family metalloprotease [Haloarchaeobius amylolyticus]